MTNLDAFKAYADAFEVAYLDSDWSPVSAYFHPDAVYETVALEPFAETIRGREAVMAYFVRILEEFDHRFDSREPVITEGPAQEADGSVVTRYDLTYRLNGAPDLRMRGIETARYRDGLIIHLENALPEETTEEMMRWMAQHAAKLPPPASREEPAPADGIRILDDAQAESYWLPRASQGYATILLCPESSACNAYSAGTHVVPPGGALPERRFARGDFIVHVLAGEAVATLDGAEERVGPGDTVVVGRQVTHQVANAGDGELRLLWFSVPTGYERLLRSGGRARAPTETTRPDLPDAPEQEAALDYYQGPAEIGARAPGKGQAMVVREADRQSYWQSLPAVGYADAIVSPHNYASNAFAVGAQTLYPKASIPPHAHRRNEELLFVTEGSGFAVTGSGEIPIRPGNAVFAGRHALHGFTAADHDRLTVVWIFSPPELETVLAALGAPRIPGEEAPEPFMPPDNVLEILEQGGFAPL